MYPIGYPINQNGVYNLFGNPLFPAVAENGSLFQVVQQNQQNQPCEVPEDFHSSYMKMNNSEKAFYLSSLDYTHNFVDTSKAFQDKIYNEFYGPPGLSTAEPKENQNPLDRYFALKRILNLPGDASSPSSVNMKRKRAILAEMERVSEIIRRGPPKVVECPPWSRHIKPFCNIKVDEKNENTDTKPTNSPKPNGAGMKICLSTHVVDNKKSVTSKEVFYPFSSSETSSKPQTITNDSDTNVASTNLQNIAGASNSK